MYCLFSWSITDQRLMVYFIFLARST